MWGGEEGRGVGGCGREEGRERECVEDRKGGRGEGAGKRNGGRGEGVGEGLWGKGRTHKLLDRQAVYSRSVLQLLTKVTMTSDFKVCSLSLVF